MTDREPTITYEEPDYPDFEGDRLRDRLLAALRADLLGPGSEDEVLTQSPATRYLVGMLAPQGSSINPAEDEADNAPADDDESAGSKTPMSMSLQPSSIGLSVVVDTGASLESTATWGEYEKREAAEQEIEADEASDLDLDEDPEEGGTKKKRKVHEWTRTPRSVSYTLDVPEDGHSYYDAGDGVRLEWIAERLGDHVVLSIFLVNDRVTEPGRRPKDEAFLYEPEIRVKGSAKPFRARRVPRDDEAPDPDPDLASTDLIYRERREFATGHGVAASWDAAIGDDAAGEVWTEVIPARIVPKVDPLETDELDIDTLADADADGLDNRIGPFLERYESWIGERAAEAAELTGPDAIVAKAHVKLALRSLKRMRAGLTTLREIPEALEAFQFANRVMALQRRKSVEVLLKRRDHEIPTEIPARWRPFQLGFILQALTGIARPGSEERTGADLLWFPTGGGKTEAYLGLTAFTLALRRLTNDDDYDFSAGTAVLMRYTLRLLTIQQFHRALAMICACEVVRRSDPDKWGKQRFTIGLWVGQSVTPNNFDDSRRALESLVAGDDVYEKSPYQVLYCPWCGEDIEPRYYDPDKELRRTFIKCWNDECDFHVTAVADGIPALVVDEEIYHHPPSLVLATVDKFAQMAWNGRIQALFGRVTRNCPRHGYLTTGEKHEATHKATFANEEAVVGPVSRPLAPPDLIIQDEIHLISGPLGTLVGIYEAAVDGLCERTLGNGEKVRPKVIASTATIRRARRQVEALFARSIDVFPPLGLDVADSFFAVENRDAPGRLYIGVFGPGRSIKTILVRTYAALLSRAKYEHEKNPSEETDSYMTLVGYFNSLRELGGALRLIDDDVPARLRLHRRRGFGPSRILYEKQELTSRLNSSLIGRTLKELDRSFPTSDAERPQIRGEYPIDVLLASNMISVGVDIDRLGLMVVSAQPKTSAEYIQATSRVGRVHPGLILEVYNWIRPRDISHYERFNHYHDTFYRHVEATSVTPFSERARDRALPGVLVSYARQLFPQLSPESGANGFDGRDPEVQMIIDDITARAAQVTGRTDVENDTRTELAALADSWTSWADDPMDLIYSTRGQDKAKTKAVLMRPLERSAGQGAWEVAGSLREVEDEVDVILKPSSLDEGGG